MGNPISATFANIFMSSQERKWLDECPLDFRPIIYRRYVDDTFLIFRKKEHVMLFFNYLNSKHPKIKFTKEEGNKRLPFLDLLLEKNNTKLDISVYRKPTFTGLGTNYLSACFEKYKMNTMTTLLNRDFSLT